MSVDRLLGLAATLPSPFVLLEDGRASGTTHLVWGARRRWRRPWPERAPAPLELPAGRWYGSIAYEQGLPGLLRPAAPVVAQPGCDCFEPANHIVLRSDGTPPACEGPEAAARWRSADELEMPSAIDLADQTIAPGEPWRSFDAGSFTSAVLRAQELIAAGDIYQVNLSVAERWPLATRPWEAYLRLRALNPSPWMGYADFGDWQLVCGSPELLVELEPANGALGGAGRLRTRPIAGTRKKTGDPDRDVRMRAELRLDEKERAEHVMLLDLARNDTGRVAEFGSVVVAEREAVEEYSHVFHLVSEVQGDLRAGFGAADVIASYFPGGTITGCPKIRAMEIIHELEPVARGAYTGALGWVAPDALQLNIVIRSAVVSGGEVAIQAGAGVVADSIPEREWRESLRKAAAVRAAFGFETPGQGG